MSGSRWVITPLCLSGSWRSFLYSSSLYSCHLFLISSAGSLPFLSFIMPVCMKCSLGISNFLEEISSLSILLFSSISLHWSLRKAFLSLLAILWNSAFRWIYFSFSPLFLAYLLFSAICKASSDNHLSFCISSWGWFWSPLPVQCHEPPSIVLQALCLSGTLSTLNLFVTSTV